MKRKGLLVYCLLIISSFDYCHSTDEEFKNSVLKQIQELKNADTIKTNRINSLEVGIEDQRIENQKYEVELNQTNQKLLEYKNIQSELENIKLEMEIPKLATAPENCGEVARLGIESSRFVTLDPDGQNLNKGPILGYCDLPSGLTILGEDTVVDVQNCDSLHCFEHNMSYAAPDSQMVALIESSQSCFQSIKMECLSAPYQFNGQTLLQWVDRHGNTHPMANLGASQCNLKAPTIFVDEGMISDKSLLPIKGFSYGPLRFEAERAKITIGKLKCEPLPYEPSTTPDPMKTGMIEEQQIAINSLIDRVNKLEQHDSELDEIRIKTKCGVQWAGTNDLLSFKFCSDGKCCFARGIRFTNGKENSARKNPVDCTTPDKFEDSKLGACKDLRFSAKSKITGRVSYYNNGNNGWHGDWVKLISKHGITFKCEIVGWIDGDEAETPKTRDFTCKVKV